jgi:hypothetical protein
MSGQFNAPGAVTPIPTEQVYGWAAGPGHCRESEGKGGSTYTYEAPNLFYAVFIQFRSDPVRKLSAKLYDIHHCCVYREKLLMMGRGTVRNM